MTTSTISPTQRIPWLDTAKAYGIFLVYYGHFVERISDLQGFTPGTAAFAQYKLIYSFHMPLFFILSGYSYKGKQQDFWPFFYHRFLTRILPAIFFNLVAIAIYFAEGWATGEPGLPEYYQHRNLFLELLLGHPFGNVITWFLFCLFTVEMLNYGLYPLLKNSLGKRTVAAITAIVVGYWICQNINQLESLAVVGNLVGNNFWYLDEALIAFGLYQIGVLLRAWPRIAAPEQRFRYVGLALSLGLTLSLYDLNQGPFTADRKLVMMASLSHGDLLIFIASALSGSVFVIWLAQILPGGSMVEFIGKNTLILLGINFFFAGLAKPVLGKLGLSLFDSGWIVFLACTVMTLISFTVSVPVIRLLQRVVPQLVGQPRASGPLLPPLL